MKTQVKKIIAISVNLILCLMFVSCEKMGFKVASPIFPEQNRANEEFLEKYSSMDKKLPEDNSSFISMSVDEAERVARIIQFKQTVPDDFGSANSQITLKLKEKRGGFMFGPPYKNSVQKPAKPTLNKLTELEKSKKANDLKSLQDNKYQVGDLERQEVLQASDDIKAKTKDKAQTKAKNSKINTTDKKSPTNLLGHKK